MAKNKEVKEKAVVEDTREGSVVETGDVVETTQEKLQAAVVIAVDPEGKLVIQDGKEVFGEEQVANHMPDDLYVQVIMQIAKDIKRAEIVSAVKTELAKTFGGEK